MMKLFFKLSVLWVMVTSLAGCQTAYAPVSGSSQQADGLYQLHVQISHKNKSWQWVCFTELIEQKLAGFSCQNDTALPLFSGSAAHEPMKLEVLSRWLIPIDAPLFVSLIQLHLYEPSWLTRPRDSKKIAVLKTNETTQIQYKGMQITIEHI